MKRWHRKGEDPEAEGIRLAERIEWWQHKLADLGISHWEIDRVSIVSDMPHGDANASVQPADRYDSCMFWFWDEYLEDATADQVDKTIIHEWLHVAMRDLDVAIESAGTDLAYATRRVWDDRVFHEREAFVEHLARTLHALHKG